MGFLDDVAAGPTPRAYPKSKIDSWLPTLNDEDREAALSILSDPSWTHTEVANLLSRYGCSISGTQVGKYRRANGVQVTF